MTAAAGQAPRLLAVMVGLGIANHVVLAGSRVAVSLDALARGATPFTVGVLMALYAFLPALLAVPAGRLCDRVGAKRPMRIGAGGLIVGAALPVLVPGLPMLFASAALVGVSFMVFQVGVQNATGHLGDAAGRAKNFSMLAMGYSISGFLGPLVAGLSIDHIGFRGAFAVLAAIPVGTSIVLARRSLRLPRGERGAVTTKTGVLALLRQRPLRRVFAINVLYAVGWDLHTLFVPLYGARIGLTASQIGSVLSVFAAATFVVRLAIPALLRRFDDRHVLTGALCLAGSAYVCFPLAESALVLAALSFVLGLGLGSGQPMVMSLLHAHAPPGRAGEAVGLRMSVVQATAVGVPLLFGAVGASVGLAPVFLFVGAALACGALLARKA